MSNKENLFMLTGLIVIFGWFGYYALREASKPLTYCREYKESRSYIPPTQKELDSINGNYVKPRYYR